MDFQKYFKKSLPHLISIFVIILVNVVYFYPQLQGKKLQQVDIITANAKHAETRHYSKDTGDPYLWTNGQFSGMPRLLTVPAKSNLVIKFYDLLKLGFSEPIGLFITMMILNYALMIFLGLHPFLSLILSIGLGLSTDNLLLWGAGHNTKVRALAFMPFMILGILYLFEKQKYLLGSVIFAVATALNIYARHPQMTYYLLIALAVYGLIKLIRSIQTKELKPLGISVGLVVFTGLLALGTSISKIWPMYEYNKSSMRGEPILITEKVNNTDASSSSEVDGLDWEYAMSWSNSLGDLFSIYIPGLVGGGSGEKVGRNSESYKAYRIEQAPLYWGKLPFTEGPLYLGAVMVFLFVFGLFYVKGDLKIWLGIAVLLTLLLSMGKYFPLLNKPLFDYLPLYNKFRTPQSILSVTKLMLPILAALALAKVLKQRDSLKVGKKTKKIIMPADFKRSLLWSAGICGGLALGLAILGPSLFTFEGASDARYTQGGMDISPFIADRKSLLQTSSFRTFLLVALTASGLWFYMKKAISRNALIAIIGVLILFDVWTIGNRYLSHDDFISQQVYNQNFQQRPVDQQILAAEPKREGYRVLDLTINTFNSSSTSYWHNTIGGYHPAKLQRYQDLVERHISQNNQAVLNMLNCKYIIGNSQNGQQPIVQTNPGALGNAWFVGEITKVNSPVEEINALSNLAPANQAIVLDTEFDNYIGSFAPTKDANGSIQLTDYVPDHLTYQSNASTEQLAVFSETWYGPDKGWTAYIDGEEVEFIRANYILRAMRVPAGQHTIEFKFHPKSFYLGERISLFSSLILVLFTLGFLGFQLYQGWKSKPLVIEEEKPKVAKPKKSTGKKSPKPKKKK